ISHPAFMPSSMSLPIVAISASVGGRFVGSCVKMLMKRMSILLGLTFACLQPSCRTVGRQIDMTHTVFWASRTGLARPVVTLTSRTALTRSLGLPDLLLDEQGLAGGTQPGDQSHGLAALER